MRTAGLLLFALLNAACGKSESTVAAPKALPSTTTTPVAPSAEPSPAPPASKAAEPRPNASPLLAWIGDHKTAGWTKGLDGPHCHEPGDLEAGWCEGTAAKAAINVRWRQTDPKAVQIELSEPLAGTPELRCTDLGAEELRRWRWEEAVSTCSHCVIKRADSPLVGMHVHIKNEMDRGRRTWVSVFSERYLLANKDLADAVATQGTPL